MDAYNHEAARAVRSALEQRSAETLLIVDFDETLWLRNSTEEYLNSLRPRFLAWLILLTLDVLRPWAFFGGGRRNHVYRDWLRVLVCTILMPWSLALWRRRARTIGRAYQNEALLGLLREAGGGQLPPLQIATLGTDAIVRPLLKEIAPEAQLMAAGTLWSGHRIRSLGKRVWIEERHGSDALKDAIVITDSDTDADLLGACAAPVLVTWPGAEFRPALSDSYIPFLYTQRGKRPGERYMLYGVLLEDVLLLWLAFAWLMPSPIAGALGLLLLHLSFWTIYELGYAENDILAVRHEANPQLWGEAALYAKRVKPVFAWLTCCLLGAAGLWLLVAFNPGSFTVSHLTDDSVVLAAIVGAIWFAYVAAARGVYWLYNRLDVGSRGHFYVVLQLLRTVGYALLLVTNLTGMFILLALVFARWVKYLVYRDLGTKLKEDQRFLMLLFYGVLFCTGLLLSGLSFATWQALAALAWFAIYSRRRLTAFAGSINVVKA